MVEWLGEFGLYAKAEKCHFGVSGVGFLGFIISPNGIGMKSDCISLIVDLPTPESIWDVQVLLGFTNFYQQLSRKYAKVTTPILDLVQKPETSRTPKKLKWEWTRHAELVFRKLKMAFTTAPILNHFDPVMPIILPTNASGFAITGILNQNNSCVILRPGNFNSRTCSGAEHNYDKYDRELLAIVDTMKY